MPPHLLDTPPPPQVAGAVQVPQSSKPPQPSGNEPHSAPAFAQVVGVQVPTGQAGQLRIPPHPSPCGPQRPPHASGVQTGPESGHGPQSIVPPQPSPDGPHFTPSAAQVFGVQVVPPHLPVTPPPPHVAGATQVPHESAPPQPSAHEPQV